MILYEEETICLLTNQQFNYRLLIKVVKFTSKLFILNHFIYLNENKLFTPWFKFKLNIDLMENIIKWKKFSSKKWRMKPQKEKNYE